MRNIGNNTRGNHSPIISGNSGTIIYQPKFEDTGLGKPFSQCTDDELINEGEYIKELLQKEKIDKIITMKSEIKHRFIFSIIVIISFSGYFFIKEESLYNISLFVIAAFTLIFTIFPVKQYIEPNEIEYTYYSNLREIKEILLYRQRKDLVKELNK